MSPRKSGGCGMVRRVDAALRIAFARAGRRPLAHREQVRGQAPRADRLEQVVLEDELARVRPVVRDLARVVVAHHVPAAAVPRAVRVVPLHASERAPDCGADEPVHRTAVDVALCVEQRVRAAEVAVCRVVVRPNAAAARIGRARARGDSVRAGKGPE